MIIFNKFSRKKALQLFNNKSLKHIVIKNKRPPPAAFHRSQQNKLTQLTQTYLLIRWQNPRPQ